MNTVQRIAKNTSVLLISQIASYILGFFFIMYTARYLGAEGFGINPFCKQKAFTEKRIRKRYIVHFICGWMSSDK